MADGASRLFNVMKQTSESTNTVPSQVVSLTVKSTSPLLFTRDDRLEITEEFCVFNKNLSKESIQVGDIITAFVFNEGQLYFIQQNDSAEEVPINYNDLNNKPKINGIELNGDKSESDLNIDKNIINLLYPIGSIYMTSTNTNPSATLGGTWTLVDKEFSESCRELTQGTDYTINTTNVKTGTKVIMKRIGHNIWFRFEIYNNVALGETDLELLTLDFSKIGITSITYSLYEMLRKF